VTYRIRTVAELTGIPRNTLIAWERRYGVVRPIRHENGYRSYSDEDVARLLRIKNAQAAGLKVSEAMALIEHQESGSRTAPSDASATTDLPLVSLDNQLARLRDELVRALVEYDKEEATRIIAQLTPLRFNRRLETVYFPALREIGDRWERGEISIVQEHYASAILRSHFASLLVEVGPSNPRAVHAACTTFPGDLHEMSALALAIQLSLDGYRVSYLGPNLPAQEVMRFVRQQRPRLLCVSVVLPVGQDSIREYVEAVSPTLDPSGLLVLGGKHLAGMSLPHAHNVSLRPEWGVDFALPS
jgi:MerR family transcriptional regulator, light-induced transcriptional regulator